MAVTTPRAHAPSALAQALLMEIRDEPRWPISARELGETMGLSEAETFPLLEQLEEAGLVTRHEATVTEPLKWEATEQGYAYPADLRGLHEDLMLVEAYRGDSQRVFALGDEHWRPIAAALGVPEHRGVLMIFRRADYLPY